MIGPHAHNFPSNATVIIVIQVLGNHIALCTVAAFCSHLITISNFSCQLPLSKVNGKVHKENCQSLPHLPARWIVPSFSRPLCADMHLHPLSCCTTEPPQLKSSLRWASKGFPITNPHIPYLRILPLPA